MADTFDYSKFQEIISGPLNGQEDLIEGVMKGVSEALFKRSTDALLKEFKELFPNGLKCWFVLNKKHVHTFGENEHRIVAYKYFYLDSTPRDRMFGPWSFSFSREDAPDGYSTDKQITLLRKINSQLGRNLFKIGENNKVSVQCTDYY